MEKGNKEAIKLPLRVLQFFAFCDQILLVCFCCLKQQLFQLEEPPKEN